MPLPAKILTSENNKNNNGESGRDYRRSLQSRPQRGCLQPGGLRSGEEQQFGVALAFGRGELVRGGNDHDLLVHDMDGLCSPQEGLQVGHILGHSQALQRHDPRRRGSHAQGLAGEWGGGTPGLGAPLLHTAGTQRFPSREPEAYQRTSSIVLGAGLEGDTGWQGWKPRTRPILLKSKGPGNGVPPSCSPPGPCVERGRERRDPRLISRASAAPQRASGHRVGGKAGGYTLRHTAGLPSAHALPIPADFLAAQPGSTEVSPCSPRPCLCFSSRSLSARRADSNPFRCCALSSGTVIVPSWSRPRTRLRAKSFLPRKQHEQGIVDPIGRLSRINIRLRRRAAGSLAAALRLILYAAFPLATMGRPPSAVVTKRTF